VVVQALNCGLPCIVSDRVGAGDLIAHRRNGSIFPAGDADALATEIAWWAEHPDAFQFRPHRWDEAARQLVGFSAEAIP
jgi:glycosyltransferase involved in cell wall biosynthesis